MRYRLNQLLRCPQCGNSLKLNVYFEVSEPCPVPSWVQERELYAKDILEGALSCVVCRRVFPIVEGVPRMYLNAWLDFPAWRTKAASEMARAQIDSFPEEKGVRKSRESFSAEWNQHKPGDVTWIWALKERLDHFIEEVGLDPRKLVQPLILDAGCGNGELTDGLTTWQAESVGIDLSLSVVRAEQRRTSALVHYVQGDLLSLPLQHNTFDLIYSAGVLHHTAYPRLAFQQLVRCLNSSGRMYIWVYGTAKYADLAAYTATRRRDHWLKPFVVPLPSALQRIVLFPIALRYWARSRLKGGDREMPFARAKVLTFDYYTPYYRSHHHFEEVQEWFRSEGLVGITLAGVTEAGFGVFGSRMI